MRVLKGDSEQSTTTLAITGCMTKAFKPAWLTKLLPTSPLHGRAEATGWLVPATHGLAQGSVTDQTAVTSRMTEE